MKSAWFHGWNLPDFIIKSAGFHHEIHRISWNSPDFMKSTRFHHEICRISSWNLPDFMKFTWFHEIHQISPWNPLDFMNTGFFFVLFFRTNKDIQYECIFHQNQSPWHEIHRISWILDFFCFILQNQYRYTVWMYFSSEPKSLAWKLPDFMKSTRFHVFPK